MRLSRAPRPTRRLLESKLESLEDSEDKKESLNSDSEEEHTYSELESARTVLIRLPLSREVLLLLASVQRKELKDGLEKQELPNLRPDSQELTEELLKRSKTEIDSSRRSQMPRRLVL